jgi:hypothetical protein
VNVLACPRCAQVDQVQSVQSTYATQSGVTHTSGIAVGGSLAGPMAARVTSHGTQASHLALRLAPPPQPRRRSAWGCGTLFAFLGSIGVGAVAFAGSSVTTGTTAVKGIVIGVGAFCVVPVLLVATFRRERALKREYREYAAVWPAMTQVWQNAMACLRCHGVFFPPEVPYPRLAAGQLIPIDRFHDAVTEIGTRLILAPDHRPLPPPPRETGPST